MVDVQNNKDSLVKEETIWKGVSREHNSLNYFTIKSLFKTRPDIQSALDRAMAQVAK